MISSEGTWWMKKAAGLGLVCSFLTFDVLWFLRLASAWIASTLLRSRLRLTDESRVYSICTTHDLDVMGHMNNARYLREFDFGRFDFWFRTPLSRKVGWAPVVQHACAVRYRRSVNFLRPFVIITRLIWWDERSLYFEQRLQTLPDGFVRATAISKSTLVGDHWALDKLVQAILAEESGELGPVREKPPLRTDLNALMEFNQLNSELLWNEIQHRPDDDVGQKFEGDDGGEASGLQLRRCFTSSSPLN